jgi:hypothetical protein
MSDFAKRKSLIGMEKTMSPVAELNMVEALVFSAVMSSIAASEKKDTNDLSAVYFCAKPGPVANNASKAKKTLTLFIIVPD